MPTHTIKPKIDANHDQVVGMPPEPLEGKTKICQPAGESLKDFLDWLQTQPPSGRTVEEIEAQIREERDSWND